MILRNYGALLVEPGAVIKLGASAELARPTVAQDEGKTGQSICKNHGIFEEPVTLSNFRKEIGIGDGEYAPKGVSGLKMDGRAGHGLPKDGAP